jgi:hypothetical protein
MYILLDIMGGFIMAVTTGLGWYAWKEEMHITFICYWGMMSLFNGVLDLVKLIDHQVKSPQPMFSAAAGTPYNIASGVQLAIPISAILGALLAWSLYKDATCDTGSVGYSNQERVGQRTSLLAQPRQQPSFTTFAGQGNRLGDVA